MTDDDPPLFAALAAIHRFGPRHHLREDRMTFNDSDLSDPRGRYGSGYSTDAAYGADDDPRGPQAPPLDPSGGNLNVDPDDDPRHSWPFGWSDITQQPDPAITALTGQPGGIRDLDPADMPVGTGLVACPTCGTGVAVDRIGR